MAKRKTGTEAEIPETETPEPELPEQESQLPTAEEQLKTLQAQVQALTSEKERLEGGYKGLQRTLEERTRESKRTADLDGRIGALQDSVELLATAMAGQRGEVEDGELPEKRRDILAELKQRRQEQENRRKQEETQRSQQEYAQKADAVYTRAKAAYGDDDDAIERIEDLLMNGRLERAEARVSKAEQSKGKGEKQPVETEEQRIDKLAEQKLQKALEERGLLESFSGYPSAASQTGGEAMSLFIAGKITADEAKKRGAKFL